MILLFLNKTLPDKKYDTNKEVSIINPIFDIDGIDTTEQVADINNVTVNSSGDVSFNAPYQAMSSFFAPTEDLQTTCKYPINIREMFPYWLRLKKDGDSVLISLTEHYYNWLNCHTTDISSLSFLRLEDLIDLENIPENLIEHLAYTYLNSLPAEEITNKTVSPERVKNLIDNIKVNLYSKKGAEDSFKLLINEFFGVDPDKVIISYPKKYVFRLNGGRFDWMSDNLESVGNYNTNPDSFYPQLAGSILNYSVLQDNYLWQDYSYVVNVSGLTQDVYERTIKPVLHPAGTLDFFNLNQEVFTNIDDATVVVGEEVPLFENYSMYKLGSTATIGYTFGCTAGSGGVTAPIYTFPSWDRDIFSKYYTGMTFGMIQVGDFLTLTPRDGYDYPNDTLICPNT